MSQVQTTDKGAQLLEFGSAHRFGDDPPGPNYQAASTGVPHQGVWPERGDLQPASVQS